MLITLNTPWRRYTPPFHMLYQDEVCLPIPKASIVIDQRKHSPVIVSYTICAPSAGETPFASKNGFARERLLRGVRAARSSLTRGCDSSQWNCRKY